MGFSGFYTYAFFPASTLKILMTDLHPCKKITFYPETMISKDELHILSLIFNCKSPINLSIQKDSAKNLYERARNFQRC